MRMRTVLLLAGCLLAALAASADTLAEAIDAGSVPQVTALLDANPALLNAPDANGYTPLHLACRATQKDATDVVKLLLARGAAVNARTPGGGTPAFLAAVNAKDRVVPLLVEKGADLTLTDTLGATFLHAAAYGGNPALVQLGLATADANAADKNGCTPLHYLGHRTMRDGQPTIFAGLSAFMQVGALVFLDDLEDQINAQLKSMGMMERMLLGGELKKPLKQMAEARKKRSADMLASAKLLVAKGANVNAANADGETPALGVASFGYTEVMQFLVDSGADLKARGKGGETVLHAASVPRSPDILQYLVRKGCDMKWTDEKGDLPIHVAARYVNQGACAYLLTGKFSINTLNNDGRTALHEVASWSTPRAIKIATGIIKCKVNVNAQDKDGDTALHRAVMQSGTEMPALLLKSGAKRDIKNAAGKTPLDLARENRYAETIALLEK